jgi:hypothetical protein
MAGMAVSQFYNDCANGNNIVVDGHMHGRLKSENFHPQLPFYDAIHVC